MKSTIEADAESLLRDSAWLHALTLSLVEDANTAADVAQDALLSLLRRPQGSVRSVRPWLARVARRLAARARTPREEPAPVEPAVPVDPSQVVVRASMQREVVDAVLRLNEPTRTAMLLHYLEQLTVAEIAQRCGAPVETVRTRVKRGLAAVRADLDRRHGDTRAWAVPILAGARPLAATAAALTPGILLMSTWKVCSALLVAGAVMFGIAELAGTPGAPPDAPTPLLPVANPETARLEPESTRAPAAPERRAAAVLPSAPATHSTCTGRIVHAGSPVADAAVSWIDTWSKDRTGRSVTTDATGTFTLEDDSPITRLPQEIVVRHERYAPRYVSVYRVERWRDGRERDIELGDVEVMVGREVGGRVVDATGAVGIAGARLFLYRSHSILASNAFAIADPITHSDRAGVFTLPGRFVDESFRQLLFAAGDDGVGFAELSRGQSDIEIRLRPTVDLEVSVVDHRDQPLAGVEIQVDPLFWPFGASLQPSPAPARIGLEDVIIDRFRASTDDTGTATLTLPIGEDGEQMGKPVAGSAYRVFASERVWRDVEVDGTPLRLVIGSAALTVAGTVSDGAGRPVSNATVSVYGDTGHEATTDASGGYSIDGVSASRGLLTVQAQAPGFTRTATREAVGDRAGTIRVDLTIRAAGRLSGRVVDQHGVPVETASVWQGATSPARERRDITDRHGRFELDGVPLGDSWVRLEPPPEGAWGPIVMREVSVPSAALELVIRRRAPGTARVSIRLVEAGSRRELTPRRATLEPIDERGGPIGRSARTRIEAGRIVAEGLAAGRWRAQASSTVGHTAFELFELGDGEVKALELESPAPASVLVRIGGAVPDRMTLECFPWSGASWRSAGRISSGDFGNRILLDTTESREVELLNLRPGMRTTIKVVDSEGVFGELTVELNAGERREVALLVTAAGQLRIDPGDIPEDDWIALSVHYGDEDWSQGVLAPLARHEDGIRKTVRAGVVHWRVTRMRMGGGQWLAEGVDNVAAGATITVPATWKQRR